MSQQVTCLILLPLFFSLDDPASPGSPVPDDLFILTGNELAARFGGATLHLQREAPPRGFWWDHGILYQDVLAMVEVDVSDTPTSRVAVTEYARTVLIPRFRQKAIYVRFVRIEGLAVTGEPIAP